MTVSAFRFNGESPQHQASGGGFDHAIEAKSQEGDAVGAEPGSDPDGGFDHVVGHRSDDQVDGGPLPITRDCAGRLVMGTRHGHRVTT